MPKQVNRQISIDLLKPQSNPLPLIVSFGKWLFSAGRFIIIFVELIVLAAFLSRFKFDADLADVHDSIDQQIPFVESLKGDELLIRQFQLQLSTIRDIRSGSTDFSLIFKKIASQTPSGVTLTNVNLENSKGKVSIHMNGTAQNNNSLSTLIFGLKEDKDFSDINLAGVSLEQGLTNFTITGLVNSRNLISLNYDR